MDKLVFATKDLFHNFVEFKGRLSRAGYWYAYLAYFIMAMIISVVSSGVKAPWISAIFSLVYFLPLVSAEVRRFHDVGKSGKLLLGLILAKAALGIVFYVSFIATLISSIASIYVDGFPIGGFMFGLVSLLAMIGINIYEIIILATASDGPNEYGKPVSFYDCINLTNFTDFQSNVNSKNTVKTEDTVNKESTETDNDSSVENTEETTDSEENE